MSLARHYREAEELSIVEIATRLGRSPATIREYFYDPDRSVARKLRESYRGTCKDCGAPTGGTGPGRARGLCARCSGQASAKWDRSTIEAALRAWVELYGKPATSTDLSLTYARRRVPHDNGERLGRLTSGWKQGAWPPASVVQYHYGNFRTANKVAFAPGKVLGGKDGTRSDNDMEGCTLSPDEPNRTGTLLAAIATSRKPYG